MVSEIIEKNIFKHINNNSFKATSQKTPRVLGLDINIAQDFSRYNHSDTVFLHNIQIQHPWYEKKEKKPTYEKKV